MRKHGKSANFQILYGTGVQGLSEKTGLSIPDTRKLWNGFWDAYPEVKRKRDELASDAKLFGHIVTRTGRVLPVDHDRGYAALNYYIQSGCRDITAQALINLWDAGFGEKIRLVVHDEIVFSLEEDFDEALLRSCMETSVDGLALPVEVRRGGQSWGSLYEETDEA